MTKPKDKEELEPGEIESVEEDFDEVDPSELNFPVPDDY